MIIIVIIVSGIQNVPWSVFCYSADVWEKIGGRTGSKGGWTGKQKCREGELFRFRRKGEKIEL